MKVPKEKIKITKDGISIETVLFFPVAVSYDYEHFSSGHWGASVCQDALRYMLIELVGCKTAPKDLQAYYMRVAKELWPEADGFHQLLRKVRGTLK